MKKERKKEREKEREKKYERRKEIGVFANWLPCWWSYFDFN